MNGGRIITTGEDQSSARVAQWAGLLGVYIPSGPQSPSIRSG